MKIGCLEDQIKDKKWSMIHESEVKLRNAKRMSFGEYLASVTSKEILLQSHLVMNARFGRWAWMIVG